MAASKNEFTATEIRAGTLVLVSFVILVVFIAAIRGCGPKDETAKEYHASFTDIAGLNHGADVRFGGVRVGKVTAIEPNPDNRTEIRVSMEVAGAVPVNRGSVVSVQQISLTAEKHVEISTGTVDSPLHQSGDHLTSRTGSGGFVDIPDLEGLTARLEVFLDSATVLVGGTPLGGDDGESEVDLLDVAAALEATLNESTGAVRGISTVITENRQGIDQIVANLVALEQSATQLMTQIDAVVTENREPLNQTLVNLQQLTEETNARVEDLTESLVVTFQHLQDTGGNFSDLIEEQRPAIEEILINLQATTRNLSEFSRILADQPNALIRGKGRQGRKGGEK